MRKNKKLLTKTLTLILAVSSLAGCAKTNEESTAAVQSEEQPAKESVELNVAAFEGAYGSAFWDDIVAGFEEMYKDENITVNVTASPKIDEIVTPQIRNGQIPDVMYFGTNQPSGFTNKLVASGSLLKLTDLLEENVPGEDIKLKDKILEGFLDTTNTMPYADGDTFMLPLFYSTNGLFYNADLFNEDGSDGKYKLPVTWDDFYELGEKANQDGRKLFIYPKAGYLDNFLFAEVAASAGLETLGKWTSYEDVYSDENFKIVFEKLAGLKPYFAWDVFDSAKPIDNQAQILNNAVLFVPSGSWMPGELADYKKADGFTYGFMAPPAFTEDGERYCAGMIEQVFALRSGDAAREDAARKFLLYLYTDEAAKVIAEKGKGMVPINGIMEIAKSAGIDELTLSMYGVYDKGAKFVAGSFVSANAEGVNWKQTYCFSMDSIMQGLEGCDAQWWIDRMKNDAALLKEGIQAQ